MSRQRTTTPPLSLIEQWKEEWECYTHVDGIPTGPNRLQYIATQAALWGAQQNLKTCIEWMTKNFHPLTVEQFCTDCRCIEGIAP